MECNERVLSFIAEWFDPHPQIIKKFLLKYHCATTEVEMKDIQTKRTFLKKTKVPPTLKEESFFVGANILLLSRDLKLIQYADNDTRNLLEPVDERTVVVCPSSLFESLGDVVSLIEEGGFTLVDLKTTSYHGTEEAAYSAAQLLNNIDSKELSSRPEPLVAMSFRGTNSIQAVKQLIETSSFNNVKCSTNAEEAAEFTNFFLKQQSRSTATFEACTCCVIKPHAVVERQAGNILSSITSRGFTLSAASSFTLGRAAAAEFLEVYDGVVPEYPQLVDELCSGRLLALEVRLKPQGDSLPESESTSVVDKFRQACGPWDVEYAKELHPESLRAKYGTDKVRNAIHCTDLPKDGPVESEYFFKILSNANSIDG